MKQKKSATVEGKEHMLKQFFSVSGFLCVLCGKVFVLIFLAVASAHAHDAVLADQVAQQLRALPVVRANFAQSKNIAVLKRPVVSTGRFVFSREHGIAWELLQPLRITYLLQAAGVTEIAADGRVRRQSGREAQGMYQVGKILNALWSGQSTVLDPLFNTDMQGRLEQWSLKLSPKSTPLSDFLARVSVTGAGARIERVQVTETGGDVLTIVFQPSAEPVSLSLTPQELQLFATAP